MLTSQQIITPEILKRYPIFPVPIVVPEASRDFYDARQFREIDKLSEQDRRKHEGLIVVSAAFLAPVPPLSLNDPTLDTLSDNVSVRERTVAITDQYYLVAGTITLAEYKMVSPENGSDTLYSLSFESADASHPSTFKLAYSTEDGLIEHEVAGQVPFEQGNSPFDRAISHLNQASGTTAFN